MSNLTLLRASAGSGKTYQLTLKYLEHLLKDPLSYKRILAVTFTNKASNEMKERIISSLYLLAQQHPKVEGYKRSLLESNINFSDSSLAMQAKKLLEIILNDYSAFSVGTIDKFFQWVIRGFTRELGLQTGYNLELNSDSILTEAIDRLLLALDKDAVIREWILDYTEEKLLENKNWKIESYLHGLGRQIFNEKYKELLGDTGDGDEDRKNLLALRKKLQGIRGGAESELRERASGILRIVTDKGFGIDDFKNKDRGVLGYIKGVAEASRKDWEPTDTVRKAALDSSEWVTKNHDSREAIDELVSSQLQNMLVDFLGFWEGIKSEYYTAMELQRNLYTFGLLKNISSAIRKICLENNIFLLADSSFFLKKIIDGNDTPFIYEKAGNYFDKYMLDEFQDTSRFQWENFYPLILNGLSENQPSLIVGDVKQSIYRWRNSDWKILATEVSQRIMKQRIQEEFLRVNYRSSENLIKFFNSFFAILPVEVQSIMRTKGMSMNLDEGFLNEWVELVGRVYDHAEQDFPSGKNMNSGYIESHFFSMENQTLYREYLGQKIPLLVDELQDRGIKPRDITFLVRTKAEGRVIAELLLSKAGIPGQGYNYSVISNDALYICNNPAVEFLLGMLKKISGQSEGINEAYLNHELFLFFRNENVPSNPHNVFNFTKGSDAKYTVDSYLKAKDIHIEDLQKLPLFELLEELIRIFDLGRNVSDIAYLQAFQDFVLNYLSEDTGDISSFLRHWELNGDELMLNASEEQEAMRIMTIHKAKGLQFKVVIIPFCDWSLSPGAKKSMIWVDTEGTAYDFFPMLPVNYSEQLAKTFFQKDYWNETFMGYIDNMNLLYVSFTRAENELYTFSGIKEKGKEYTMGNLLQNILKSASENDGFLSGGVYQDEDNCYLLGEKAQKSDLRKGHRSDSFFPEQYFVHNSTPSLLKNNRNIYLSSLDEEYSDPAGFGTQMHEVFSGINTLPDIESAVRRVWIKGLLSNEERDNLVVTIQEMVSEPPYSSWFDGKGEVIAEQDLVDEKGNVLRPDRVVIKEDKVLVIDFKFGNQEREKYLQQVKSYVIALEAAGYRNVKGYIWYPILGIMREAT